MTSRNKSTEEGAITTHEPTSPISGEWGAEDIRIPRLALLQNASQAAKEYGAGTFFYDKTIPLTSEENPFLEIYVLSMRKYYEEEKVFNPESRPLTWDREEDAKKDGFTSILKDKNAAKKYGRRAEVTLVVPVPTDHGLYHGPQGSFSKCLYTVKNKAFSSFTDPVLKASVDPKVGAQPWAVKYTMSAKTEHAGNGTYFVPLVVNAGPTTKPMVKWLDENVI